MKSAFFQAVLLLSLILSATNTTASDWPLWRGPDRNGISTETEWNPAALNKGAKVAWETNLGDGHSSFAIKGNMLYTMGNVSNSDIVYCINTKDGSTIWKHSYPCTGGNYPGPRAAPVLDGSNLYTFSRNAQLFCLKADSGKVVWKKDLIAEEKMAEPRWGFASSPVIEDNMLILNAGAHGIAIDKTTGKTIWSSGAGDASYASAVIFKSGSKKYAAIFSAKAMNAVDIKSGSKVWAHPWDTSYDVHAADPLILDNFMFLSSGYKTGSCLLEIKNDTPKQVWGIQSEMKNHFNSSVLINGCVYGIAGNTGSGKATCLDFKTGDIKWAEGKGYEGLMAANGKLILMDKAGFLTIAEVNPEKFAEISKAQVLDGSAQNWTVPILANGFIYCRNGKGRLVCVDMR